MWKQIITTKALVCLSLSFLLLSFVLASVCPIVRAVNSMNPLLQLSEDFHFEPDSMPGVYEEFKVELGKQECFYQHVPARATLFVSFHILRGKDMNVDLTIRNRDEIVVEQLNYVDEGQVNHVAQMDGVYSMCLGTKTKWFSAKLAHVVVIVTHHEDWNRFEQDLVEYNTKLLNVTSSLEAVQRAITNARVAQVEDRMHNTMDYYKLKVCERSVLRWSIVMTLLILVTSAFQTFFVRRLFSSKIQRLTPTAKPRA